MATLSNPSLEIDLLTGMPDEARVIATVNVQLEPLEKFLVNAGLGLNLQSDVWGVDGSFFDENDDRLFYFPSQSITTDGTYTFSRVVPRSWLNEDKALFDNSDEIASRFNLLSTSNFFPFNISIASPIIPGHF